MRLTARRRIALALGILPIVAIAVALVGARVPVRVAYWKWRLGSANPTVRVEARVELLRIARPAIDEAYPELVASEVADLLLVKTHAADQVVLFVGARLVEPFHEPEKLFYRVDEILKGVPLPMQHGWRFESHLNSRVANLLYSGDTNVPRRELVLAVESAGQPMAVWLAVPLDDDLERLVLGAVKERLR